MPNPVHDAKYILFRQMLVDARLEKNLLQSDVSDKLGKYQSYVSKYERGERRLDLPEFLEVAEALDINVTEFVKKYRTKLAKLK
ncbi:MAG: helix-turn-helix domain-containing protein [Burkholderiaceae bacterium]